MKLDPNIAFYGPPGAGKSTAAAFLDEVEGYRRVSFAGFHPGGVRDIVTRIWGHGAANDRAKLDTVAEAVRGHDPMAWINTALKQVDAWEETADPIVIDDMRTPDEWPLLKARGFVMIRMEASEDIRVDRLKVSGKFQNMEQLAAPLQHLLDDRALYPPDYTLYTEQDRATTERQLVAILNHERSKRA